MAPSSMDYKISRKSGLKSEARRAKGFRCSRGYRTMKGIELQGQALVTEGLTLPQTWVTLTQNMTNSP